jgi:hypothetical protein
MMAASIVLMFLVSVACRIPFLMRPSTGQHDEITLQSMLIIRVWDQTGLWKTHFVPAENYANPADRFIATRPLVDSGGASFYVSFPPGAFLLGYGAHRLMPNVDLRLVLKGLNLAILLLASFALAGLMEKALGPGKQGFVLAAIAVFLFNRAVLMSLGNLYNAVIIAVPMWILVVWYYQKLAAQKTMRAHQAVLYVAFIAILCYTDWIGFLAAAAFFAWPILTRRWAMASYGRLAVLAACASAATGALLAVQFSLVAGPSALIDALGGRFKHRLGVATESGDDLTMGNPRTYVQILANYVYQFRYLLLSLAVALFLLFLVRALGQSMRRSRAAASIAFCFAAPLLLEHSLIGNFSANHNFAELKGAPLLTLLWALSMAALSGIIQESPRLQLRRGSLLLITSFLCLVAVRSFLKERNDLFPADQILGQEIRAKANPAQVVFLERRSKTDAIRPNLTYFAMRNVQMVANESEATAFLKRYGRFEGVLFRAGLEGRLLGAPVSLHLQ